ncbi:HAD-IA family hydrolase [Amycolatopsis sp. NPDC005961]|uniref:Phosphatase YfbT n=1 Tax=Amycolatopsis camponoti TaxID=2606593 RepID=A0A6I8LUW2_9PSEU|nr:HAD-IA family hydrolase [Amycolatopsis camponoti]VVJ21871.1 Putative phosphatase YfbT [Amycolatopsis camponoti]
MTHPFSVNADGFLFDMDGTLVDSTTVVEAVWTRFAGRHGLDAETVIRFSHGRPSMDSLAEFLRGHSIEAREAIAADLARQELDDTDGIVEIVGAGALITALQQVRAPVAVVTSAPRDLALLRLKAAAVPVPDVLVSADDIARGKPDPEGFLKAADLLGVSVAQCVAFEDSEAGVLAACASGATTIVVGTHTSAATTGLVRIPHYADIALTTDGDQFFLHA